MKRLLCGFGVPLVVVSVVVVLSMSRISAMESQSSNDLPVDDFISEHLFSFASLNEDTKDIPLVDIGLRQKKPVWDFNVGAAILTRGTLDGSPIITGLRSGSVREDILNGSDFRFNHSAGPDISATRRLSKDRYFDSLNLRFFDVQSVSANESLQFIRQPEYLGYQFPTYETPLFDDTNDFEPQNASYATSLYSFEANVTKQVGNSQLQWLTGFRWIQVSDSLTVNAIGPITQERNQWRANNSLYGWQFGAIVPATFLNQRLNLSIAPKIGIYGNQCNTNWDAISRGTPSALRNYRNQVAFAGDLSAIARYSLSQRWSILCGYQLLWLNGVGVAGDQPETTGYFRPQTNPPETISGLNTSGSAFFHGALVGANFVW